jgi:hypothetical protein
MQRTESCDTCEVLIIFDHETEKTHLMSIMDVFCTLILIFLACTCCTFCLSMAGSEHSQLVAIAPIIDALTVDVSAATVVIAGYMFSNLYEHMSACFDRNVAVQVALEMILDIWGVCLLVSVHCIINLIFIGSVTWQSFALTVFEGVFNFRLLDTHQIAGAHNYNASAWLGMNLVCCVGFLNMNRQGLHALQQRFGIDGIRFIALWNMAAIFLVTLYAIFYTNDSLFYSILTNLPLANMQFTLGMHAWALKKSKDELFDACWKFVEQIRYVIYVLLLCVWWGALDSRPDRKEPCGRVYYFNECLWTYQLSLVQGCIIGLFGIILSAKHPMSNSKLRNCMCMISMIFFCWPVCYVIYFILGMSFSENSIRRNGVLVSSAMTAILYTVIFLYYKLAKRHLVEIIYKLFVTPKFSYVYQRLRFCLIVQNTSIMDATEKIDDCS